MEYLGQKFGNHMNLKSIIKNIIDINESANRIITTDKINQYNDNKVSNIKPFANYLKMVFYINQKSAESNRL